ncbi:hypothetical protein K439DRAFT_1617137 [Ramaria rubella]|nr:hypothetical protein K439DRAFT_1617137 [Ramaria rubella]
MLLQHTDVTLAYQVTKVFELQHIANDEHIWVLVRLQKHHAFAGILGIGVKKGTVHEGNAPGEEFLAHSEEIQEDVDGSDVDGDDEDAAADAMESTIGAFDTFGD